MKDHPFTPQIECDHSCQVRRKFSTKDQATAVQRAVFARTGNLRKVESCNHCNGWHLGASK